MRKAQLQVLKDELTGDPLARGYAGMTSQQKADDINSAYRPGPPSQGALFAYCCYTRVKDVAQESESSHIYGRLKRVDDTGAAGIGTKVFNPNGSTLSAPRLDACWAFKAIVDQDRLGQPVPDLNNDVISGTDQMLDMVIAAGVMKPVNAQDIVGLSNSQLTRANELGLPKVKAGDIEAAEAL